MHADDRHHDPSKPPRRWGPIVIGVGIAALVAVMLVLHLTGVVGPGGHR